MVVRVVLRVNACLASRQAQVALHGLGVHKKVRRARMRVRNCAYCAVCHARACLCLFRDVRARLCLSFRVQGLCWGLLETGRGALLVAPLLAPVARGQKHSSSVAASACAQSTSQHHGVSACCCRARLQPACRPQASSACCGASPAFVLAAHLRCARQPFMRPEGSLVSFDLHLPSS